MSAPALTTPRAASVRLALIVISVADLLTIVAPVGMPTPMRIWPTSSPAVVVVEIVRVPTKPTPATKVLFGVIAVMKVFACKPVATAPESIWPTTKVAEDVVLMIFVPLDPPMTLKVLLEITELT